VTGLERLAVAGWCYVVGGCTLSQLDLEQPQKKRCADWKRTKEPSHAEGKDGFKVSVALMSAPLQHAWNWALSLVALATKAASLLTPIIVA
jgi:hypothetical protein